MAYGRIKEFDRITLPERKGIKGMRVFNYSIIKEQKWDCEILGLVAAIYKESGKQDL